MINVTYKNAVCQGSPRSGSMGQTALLALLWVAMFITAPSTQKMYRKENGRKGKKYKNRNQEISVMIITIKLDLDLSINCEK
jgi:hypothetical protein